MVMYSVPRLIAPYLGWIFFITRYRCTCVIAGWLTLHAWTSYLVPLLHLPLFLLYSLSSPHKTPSALCFLTTQRSLSQLSMELMLNMVCSTEYLTLVTCTESPLASGPRQASSSLIRVRVSGVSRHHKSLEQSVGISTPHGP